jgi:hypothetical protein
MANEIDDAVQATERELPSLTWAQALKSYREVALPVWEVSGRVSANDCLSNVDRLKLADAIVKNKISAAPVKETTMPEVADTLNLADTNDREIMLAACKYRQKLAQSDDESIFSIASRLRQQLAEARAADAKKPADEATTFDASAHRPGFRDGTQWRHDRRKRHTTEQYDPEGRQEATYVSTSEEEDDPEKSLSDARNAYLEYVGNAYKQNR